MTRIISGTARGRTIAVPPEGTRPTSDRAREGLFSSLQVRFGFEGEVVLDLFAGSGALGLEAASRGAADVTFVESNPVAAATITRNLAVVPEVPARVVEAKVSTFITRAVQQPQYSMVLADPPYELADSSVADMLQALIPLLEDDAVVVIERPSYSEETQWPEGFEPTGQKVKKRTYGIARFDMAIWRGAASEPSN